MDNAVNRCAVRTISEVHSIDKGNLDARYVQWMPHEPIGDWIEFVNIEEGGRKSLAAKCAHCGAYFDPEEDKDA